MFFFLRRTTTTTTITYLGHIWESIPLFRRGTGIRGKGHAGQGHGPGEMNAVGLDNVSDKGSHRNTSVLDLGMTQKGNRGIVGLIVNGRCCQLQGIVVLQAKRRD
jgi:hypothetical protein